MTRQSSGLRKFLVRRLAEAKIAYERELNRPQPAAGPQGAKTAPPPASKATETGADNNPGAPADSDRAVASAEADDRPEPGATG